MSQAARICAIPHRTVGNERIVDERLRESLALAREHRHLSDEALALQARIVVLTEQTQYETALAAGQELLDTLQRCPPVATPPMRVDLANIALYLGDHALAREQLSLVPDVELNLHGRSELLAIQLFATVVGGAVCDESHLTELIQLSTKLVGRPDQETAIVSVALGLTQRGKAAEAFDRVIDYATRTRREVWPLRNPILLSFLSGTPIGTAAAVRKAAR